MDSASANLTRHEAERLVRHFEVLAGSGNPDRIAQSFASDVIVRLADFPEMPRRTQALCRCPHRAAEELSLDAAARAVAGDVIICSWDAAWEDGRDGRLTEGHGVELMTIREGKTALWEAVFNVWEQGKRGSLPIV